MARLEIDIVGNNSELKKVLEDSKIALSSFQKDVMKASIAKAMDDEGLATQQARTEAIKLASTLDSELKTSLNNAKIGTESARTESVKFASVLKSSLSESLNNAKINTEGAKQATESYKQSVLDAKADVERGKQAITDNNAALIAQRKATESARTATQKARQAIAELSLGNRQNEQAFDAANGSYDQARQRLASLRRAIFEAKGGFDGTRPSISAMINEYSELNNKLKSFDAQMGNHQRNVGNYALGLGNASGVTLEFIRIVQDAPFGIMGMGNNIQQLTTNWQQYAEASRRASAEQGKTITTGALLRGALSSLLTPASLLSLGVAAVTSAWIGYTMWAQRSKKSTEENNESFKKIIPSINTFVEYLRSIRDSRANEVREELTKSLTEYEKAQTSATTSARLESLELKRIYEASQDASRGISERTILVNKLKNEYPEYLSKFSEEQILAGKAAEAYNKLTISIQNTAKARVMSGFLEESIKKQIENEKSIAKLRSENARDEATLAKYREASVNSGYKMSGALEMANIDLRKSQIELLESQNKALKDDDINAEKEINSLLGNRLDIIKSAYKETNKSAKQLIDYVSKLKEIQQKGTFSSTLTAQDEGLDTQLERVRQKYVLLGQDIDKIEKQGLSNTKTNANSRNDIINSALEARKQLEVSRAIEISEVTQNYQQKTADEISSIEERAGITRIISRKRDLEQNTFYYDELARQYRNNAEILNAIVEARRVSEYHINEKWNGKVLEQQYKTYDKIKKIESKSVSKVSSNESLDEEMKKRLKAVENHYTNIMNSLKVNNMPVDDVMRDMMESFNSIYNSFQGIDNDSDKLKEKLEKVVERGLRSGIQSVFSDIKDLGSTFEEVFSNVFDKLANSVNSIFQNVLSAQLADLMKSKFAKDDFSIGGLSNNTSKALVAGLSTAGGLVSSMTKKTDKMGQLYGGALSGAAAGTAILPGWGTAIGAVVGAAAGWFSASAASKREKVQEAQLEEQKKQTALAQRMAALTYSSSIVGQQTKQGIITGVGRDAFGELTARIDGRDIVLSYDREKTAQLRGL